MTITVASDVDSVGKCCLIMVACGEGDKEDLWQRSTPECSTLELPLRGASPDVLSVFEVGAILMPVNSCGDSSGCSI